MEHPPRGATRVSISVVVELGTLADQAPFQDKQSEERAEGRVDAAGKKGGRGTSFCIGRGKSTSKARQRNTRTARRGPAGQGRTPDARG